MRHIDCEHCHDSIPVRNEEDPEADYKAWYAHMYQRHGGATHGEMNEARLRFFDVREKARTRVAKIRVVPAKELSARSLRASDYVKPLKEGDLIDCRVCGGDGYGVEPGPCRACHGSGKVHYHPLPKKGKK